MLGFGGWRGCAAQGGFMAALIVLAPAVGHAQAPEELELAQNLFQEAQSAEEAEDWTRCERELRKAMAIVETPGLRFHLAYCKERQSHWVEALADYRKVEQLLNSGVEAPDVQELLGPAIRRLEHEIPKLRLSFDHPPSKATLFLDGEELSSGVVGKSLPVDPGARTVSVTAPGYEAYTAKLNLLPAEERDLDIVLIPVKQTAAPVEPAPASTTSEKVADTNGLTTKSYVLLSEALITAAGIGVGAASMAKVADSKQQHDQVFDALGSASGCVNVNQRQQVVCDELVRLNKEIELYKGWQTAGFVTAGVGVAAFIVTWLVWPEESAQSEQGQRSGLQLTGISVAPGSGGVTGVLSGRF